VSLIWADGFEESSQWSRKYTVGGGVLPTTTTSRTNSGNCMLLTGSTTQSEFKKFFNSGDAHATFILGWAAYATNTWPTTSADPMLALFGDSGATQHIDLSEGSSGEIEVRRGASVLGETVGASLTSGVWAYWEVKVTLDDSAGVVIIKKNGTTILSLSSQDTKNGGTNTTFDAFKMTTRSSSGSDMYVDDLYVCTGAGSVYNDFLGDVRIETLRPSGNGNSSQFVGSDADSTDNYLHVDDTAYTNTDFVGSSTTTNKDTYAYGDLVRTTGQVKGVMVQGVMAKSDSGSKSARLVARTASTDYTGDTESLSTSDIVYAHVWEQNPNTTSDWTISEVNGAEFGVEVV
jgi:hypothetical protein